MLRSRRQSSSILPDHGAASPTNGYFSYGSNGYGSSFPKQGSYSNSSYYGKKRYSYSSSDIADVLPSFAKRSTSWLALGLGFFVLLAGYYQSKFQWVLRELDVNSIDQVVQTYRDLYTERLSRKRGFGEVDERYTMLERLNAKLHKEKEELRKSYEKRVMKEFTKRRQEEERLLAREDAFKSQITTLQTAAIRGARRSVTDKFGPGPHYVRFTFILPSDEEETLHEFIVETAPLDVMPHAVQLFLEQVAHKLWDSSWFYINGPHVLQAGPMLEEDESIEEDTFEADRAKALTPFKEKGLDSLSFPEYSNQFQHEKWTLGFTGRPGGPDWYINKQNNTVMHGPGGQYHHSIEEQADPCFARVISGFDKVEQMFNEATIEEGDDWEYFFWDPVYIVEAKVISKPDDLEASGSTPQNSGSAAPQNTSSPTEQYIVKAKAISKPDDIEASGGSAAPQNSGSAAPQNNSSPTEQESDSDKKNIDPSKHNELDDSNHPHHHHHINFHKFPKIDHSAL